MCGAFHSTFLQVDSWLPCVELVDWGWNLVCNSLQIQQWNIATSVIEIAYA